MELFTRVKVPESSIRIDYTKKLAFFGSCFADNISAQFASRKFNVLANPFGTVYNPLSIERQLQHIASKEVFGEDDVFQDIRRENGHGDNLWHCWDAHSSLSAPTCEECIGKLSAACAQAREFLQQADIVFITVGSAFVYSLKDDENGYSKVVANCHRQDQRMFERRLISADEAAQAIKRIVENIRILRPNAHIVFTVSPIRHIGDGAHGNNLSKATVLLGIEKTLQEIAPSAEYFPSYEIMMDELRDYRFYDRDMIHLSKTAEEIIFERMLETYCDGTTRENIAKVEKFLKMASHRIQDENSPATQEFKKKLIAQANELEKHIPGLILNE